MEAIPSLCQSPWLVKRLRSMMHDDDSIQHLFKQEGCRSTFSTALHQSKVFSQTVMKVFVVLLLAGLAVSLANADFYDNLVNRINSEVQQKYGSFLKQLYEKNQIVVVDETEKLLLEIKSFKWRWSRLWNKFCPKSKELSYCKFIKGLVKTSKVGIKKLSQTTEISHIENVKKNATKAFVDDFSQMLKKKLEQNRELVHRERLGCYFTQMRRQMDLNSRDVKTKGEKERLESISEFIERMAGFREEILTLKKQLSDSYRKCAKSKEVRHCLDAYVKVSHKR